ncbi:MAG: hypothetical protein GXY83_37005 [Rhodopirellula sp.]|nr:hypothetical protein [Rhodopirellula sp.]
MSARIQTWFPFSIQVCINGGEWLSRRMDESGLQYERYDNSFPWIEDFAKAQTIMDRTHKINWPKTLDAVARRLNPDAFQSYRSSEIWRRSTHRRRPTSWLPGCVVRRGKTARATAA